MTRRNTIQPIARWLPALLLAVSVIGLSACNCEQWSGNGSAATQNSNQLDVYVSPDGQMTIADEPQTMQSLRERFTRLAAVHIQQRVVIRGHETTKMEEVAEVLQLARDCGLTKVYVATIYEAKRTVDS